MPLVIGFAFLIWDRRAGGAGLTPARPRQLAHPVRPRISTVCSSKCRPTAAAVAGCCKVGQGFIVVTFSPR
jgi:hypothetical protein